MAIQTFNPPVPPSEGTSATQKVNLLKAEFGDGYIQTTRNGLRHLKKSIRLSWDMLTPTHAEEILDFFYDHGGYTSFLYTPSDELTPMKWLCNEWSDTRGQGGFRSIEASFEECFDDRGIIEYGVGIGVARAGAGFGTVAYSAASFESYFDSAGQGTAWAFGTGISEYVFAAAGTGSATAVGVRVLGRPGAAAGVGASVVAGTAVKNSNGFAFGLGSAQAVGATV
jgi:phage-related protein